MKRLVTTLKNDVRVQLRNKLYAIGLPVSAVTGAALSWLISAGQVSVAVPVALLVMVGGTTFLYVAGMIVFERDEGTLNATIVSPLRTWEYLASKVLSLSGLATLESTVLVATTLALLARSEAVALPSIPLLLLGAVTIAVLYTLMGVVLIVRYRSITDFLVPMAVLVMVLQLPIVHFVGITPHPAWLLVPTAAPTVIMQGAFEPLPPWQWAYALSYSAALVGGLGFWALRAFEHHVVRKVG